MGYSDSITLKRRIIEKRSVSNVVPNSDKATRRRMMVLTGETVYEPSFRACFAALFAT